MKTLTFKHSKEAVLKKVLTAASKLDLSVKHKTPNVVNLRHDGGLLSFGNNITVKLASRGRLTKVVISSKSSSPLQVIDWSTNSNLEDDLKKTLRSLLK